MPKKKKRAHGQRDKKPSRKKKPEQKPAQEPETESFGFVSDIAGSVVNGGSDDCLGAALEDMGLGGLADKLNELDIPPEVAEYIQETIEEFDGDPEALFEHVIGETSEESVEELVEFLTADYGGRSGAEVLDGLDMAAFPLMPEEQIAAARRAIEISPKRLEPYIAWMDALDEPESRATVAEAGLKLGRRLLKKTGFPRNVPEDFEETILGAGYIRLLTTLGLVLTDARRLDEAIDCWEEVLPLTTYERDTVQQHFAATLLLANRNAEALEILSQFDEDDCEFDLPYHLALLKFRIEGESPAADEALSDALDYNPHYVEYLLHPETLDDYDPADEFIRAPQTPEEARCYAREFGQAWRDTPGALEWLFSNVELAD